MFKIGNQEDVVEILEEYLEDAKRGNLSSITIFGINDTDTHSRNTIVTGKTNGSAHLGVAIQTMTDIELGLRHLERVNQEAIEQAFEGLSIDPEKAN